MHESMIEDMAEGRGYDRGFTAGTRHAHDLISKYIDWIDEYCIVLEAEGDCQHEIECYRTQRGSLNHAKHVIRKGHWDSDDSKP